MISAREARAIGMDIEGKITLILESIDSKIKECAPKVSECYWHSYLDLEVTGILRDAVIAELRHKGYVVGICLYSLKISWRKDENILSEKT